MSVKLTTHEKDGVTIVGISGKLTLGDGTSALRDRIHELTKGGSKRIVLNLADLNYIDSSGIGELVAAHTTIGRVGGEMKLLNLAKRVHDLLKITKLYTVFETFEDVNIAVASFAAATASSSTA